MAVVGIRERPSSALQNPPRPGLDVRRRLEDTDSWGYDGSMEDSRRRGSITEPVPNYQKPESSNNQLDMTPAMAFRPSTDSSISERSLDGHLTAGHVDSIRPLLRSPSPAGSIFSSEPMSRRPKATWKAKFQTVWLQSKGMSMVLLAQWFGATMNIMTQVLEVDGSHGPAMEPFQVLFARMSITVVFSYLYMWYRKVPHPFGRRDIMWLLILRAMGGFFGVFGLYYSVQYLPLSEATVLTFLAPIAACYACSFFIPNETFTRKQQLAALVSLLGVVLIARPFSSSSTAAAPTSEKSRGAAEGIATRDNSSTTHSPVSADPYHHFLAILVAMLGVLGGACAYTCIRVIGTRAHALVTVTSFAVFVTIVSGVALAALPSVPFRLPHNFTEWSLLIALGVCGFFLQFLMAAGLAYVPPPAPGQSPREVESSGQGVRATSMIYTGMLFALFYDKTVWGNTIAPISWAGSGLILGSAIYVAVAQDGSRRPKPRIDGHVGDANLTMEMSKHNNITSEHENHLEEGRALSMMSNPDELGADRPSSSR